MEIKPIFQFEKNGQFVAKYRSVQVAAKINGYFAINIYNTASGKSVTAYGYKWSYSEAEFIDKYVEHIINAVLSVNNIDYNILIKKCRKREIVQARQIAQYLLKEKTGLTYVAIAKITGKKDHATCMHSHRTIKNLLDSKNKTIIKLVNNCLDIIDEWV